ncbi:MULTISPECIES: NAD(P)H-binding protein [Eikenella]|uniref:Epimerase n=1 Tax=Eikenella longinqua TaxID=1795827 RepID=A0A1A9RX97_9NEIS|nr:MULTISPECIES: NAD(P)H-binding protein [Eikenella]OAM29362.1 epimerase [Eikenella longinqua]
MKALVIGATGATGQALLPLLAAAPQIAQIDSFGRRAPDFAHEKLHNHIIDFNNPQDWADAVRGDVVFACLGTTLKAAGSKQAQRRIDFDANLAFARAARENGVQTLVLVSAAGADPTSRIFYPRMKGELEQAVAALHFPHLLVFRPPLLIRPGSDRFGEKLAERLFAAFNAVGLLQSQRPLPVADLARAMLQAALNPPPRPVKIYPPADIRALLAKAA